VIAFEPNTESYEHLQDNLVLNGIRNVRSFRKALGERNSEGKLYQGEENADSSLVAPILGSDGRCQPVEIVAGDSFRQAQGLPIPRVVKIDVEGYEYCVLQGLRATLMQASCELVCCEVHPNFLPKEATTEMILSFVRSLGFARLDTYPRYDTLHLVARRSS
jgi:FkbM family methyltransferase